MEFLALAASLKVTVLSEGRLQATGSDAQSVLDLLPGRRQRLQQVMKDHHFLRTAIRPAGNLYISEYLSRQLRKA